MILGIHSSGRSIDDLPFRPSLEDFRQEERDLESLRLARVHFVTARNGRERDRDKIARSPDGERACMFGGELLFPETLITEIARHRRIVPTNPTAAELALIGWEVFGNEIVARLRGTFAVAFHDTANDRIVLANDRFGMHPLYVLEQGEALLFSSEAEPIAAYSAYDKRLDLQALIEYFALDVTLDGHTLFAGIRNLPPGTIAERRGTGSVVFSRSIRNDVPIDRANTLDGFVDQAAQLLRDGFRERFKGRNEFDCALTGGLDSRLFIGLLDDETREKVLFRTRNVAYFAGTDPGKEIPIAEALVEKFRLRHRFDGAVTDKLIGRAFFARSRRMTSRSKFEGHFCDNMFGGPYTQDIRTVQKAASGATTSREIRDRVFRPEVAELLDPVERAHGLRARTEAENSNLLFMAQVSMRGFLTHLTRGSAEGWVDPPRWIALNVDYLLRDPELFRFTLTIPPESLADRVFYDRLYERAFPELCTVPTTRQCRVVPHASRPKPWTPPSRGIYEKDLAEFLDSPITWDKGIYNEKELRPLLKDGFDTSITPAFVDFESWYRMRFLGIGRA